MAEILPARSLFLGRAQVNQALRALMNCKRRAFRNKAPGRSKVVFNITANPRRALDDYDRYVGPGRRYYQPQFQH